MVAFLFPGQGSQIVGMGKAIALAYPEARAVFDEADEALGFSLSKLCFEGPEDELRRTENTQPAILTTSLALLAALRREQPGLQPTIAAGHSLGEWSALVAVSALSLTDAVRAVKARGRFMQAAVPEGEGAMAAVLGLTPEQIAAVCAEVEAESGGVVRPANFNSPEQIVISGAKGAVEAAGARLEAAGAKRVVPLPVSAPFHCPLMEPAARGLAGVLAEVAVAALAAPVISNVTAEPNQDPAQVKRLLVEQVTAPVRWIETVKGLVAGGETVALELGPGKVLMGLARRIDRALKVLTIEDPDSLKKALEAL